MAREVVVAMADEIGPGERRIVEIDGRSIGVFNVDGRFYALRNRCPHAGAALCEGVLSGLVTSSGPGDHTYSRAGEFLRCPWHGWEFDITTGRSSFDPERTRVRSYDARVQPGGELIAETYPVRVDADYVVVEV